MRYRKGQLWKYSEGNEIIAVYEIISTKLQRIISGKCLFKTFDTPDYVDELSLPTMDYCWTRISKKDLMKLMTKYL